MQWLATLPNMHCLQLASSVAVPRSECTCTPFSFQILFCVQDHIDVGTSTRQSHLHGVAFPIDQDALRALQQLHNKELEYVRLVSS